MVLIDKQMNADVMVYMYYSLKREGYYSDLARLCHCFCVTVSVSDWIIDAVKQ